jgi:hypothetical protein
VLLELDELELLELLELDVVEELVVELLDEIELELVELELEELEDSPPNTQSSAIGFTPLVTTTSGLSIRSSPKTFRYPCD